MAFSYTDDSGCHKCENKCDCYDDMCNDCYRYHCLCSYCCCEMCDGNCKEYRLAYPIDVPKIDKCHNCGLSTNYVIGEWDYASNIPTFIKLGCFVCRNSELEIMNYYLEYTHKEYKWTEKDLEIYTPPRKKYLTKCLEDLKFKTKNNHEYYLELWGIDIFELDAQINREQFLELWGIDIFELYNMI